MIINEGKKRRANYYYSLNTFTLTMDISLDCAA